MNAISYDPSINYGAIHDGDTSVIPDHTVDLIIADPPADVATDDCYERIGSVSKRLLRPGGSLVVYIDQSRLAGSPFRSISQNLRYWWTLGDFCSRTIEDLGIESRWRPAFWFVSGTRGDKRTFIDDRISGYGGQFVRVKRDGRFERDWADCHGPGWPDAYVPVVHLAGRLTKPGDVVAILGNNIAEAADACDHLDRRWIGLGDGSRLELGRQAARESGADQVAYWTGVRKGTPALLGVSERAGKTFELEAIGPSTPFGPTEKRSMAIRLSDSHPHLYRVKFDRVYRPRDGAPIPLFSRPGGGSAVFTAWKPWVSAVMESDVAGANRLEQAQVAREARRASELARWAEARSGAHQ